MASNTGFIDDDEFQLVSVPRSEAPQQPNALNGWQDDNEFQIYDPVKHRKKSFNERYMEAIYGEEDTSQIENKTLGETRSQDLQEREVELGARQGGAGLLSGATAGLSEFFGGDAFKTGGGVIDEIYKVGGSFITLPGAQFLIGKPLLALASKAPKFKQMATSLAHLTTTGALGGLYGGVQQGAKEHKVPDFSDIAEHGAQWVLLDLGLQAAFKTGSYVYNAFKGSKATGKPDWQLVNDIFTQAKKDGIDISTPDRMNAYVLAELENLGKGIKLTPAEEAIVAQGQKGYQKLETAVEKSNAVKGEQRALKNEAGTTRDVEAQVGVEEELAKTQVAAKEKSNVRASEDAALKAEQKARESAQESKEIKDKQAIEEKEGRLVSEQDKVNAQKAERKSKEAAEDAAESRRVADEKASKAKEKAEKQAEIEKGREEVAGKESAFKSKVAEKEKLDIEADNRAVDELEARKLQENATQQEKVQADKARQRAEAQAAIRSGENRAAVKTFENELKNHKVADNTFNQTSKPANAKEYKPGELSYFDTLSTAENRALDDIKRSFAPKAPSKKVLGHRVKNDINMGIKKAKEAYTPFYTEAMAEGAHQYGYAPLTGKAAKQVIEDILRYGTGKGEYAATVRKLENILEDAGWQIVKDEAGKLIDVLNVANVSAKHMVGLAKRTNEFINYETEYKTVTNALGKIADAIKTDARNIMRKYPKSEAITKFNLAEESFAANAEKYKPDIIKKIQKSNTPEDIMGMLEKPSNLQEIRNVLTKEQMRQVEREILDNIEGMAEAKAKEYLRDRVAYMSEDAAVIGNEMVRLKAPKEGPSRIQAMRTKSREMILNDFADAHVNGGRPDKALDLWKTRQGQELIKDSLKYNPNKEEMLNYLKDQSLADMAKGAFKPDGTIDFKKLDKFLQDKPTLENIRMLGGEEAVEFFKNLETYASRTKLHMDTIKKNPLTVKGEPETKFADYLIKKTREQHVGIAEAKTAEEKAFTAAQEAAKKKRIQERSKGVVEEGKEIRRIEGEKKRLEGQEKRLEQQHKVKQEKIDKEAATKAEQASRKRSQLDKEDTKLHERIDKEYEQLAKEEKRTGQSNKTKRDNLKKREQAEMDKINKERARIDKEEAAAVELKKKEKAKFEQEREKVRAEKEKTAAKVKKPKSAEEEIIYKQPEVSEVRSREIKGQISQRYTADQIRKFPLKAKMDAAESLLTKDAKYIAGALGLVSLPVSVPAFVIWKMFYMFAKRPAMRKPIVTAAKATRDPTTIFLSIDALRRLYNQEPPP